jgi:glycosyltransferase involved in cell wall biosynthesis
MSQEPLRPRLYAWGRRTLPVGWRRKIRRLLPVELLFGIRKAPREGAARALRPNQATGTGRAFVFLPVISWFYRRQRPQQLAAALARQGHRVFYAALRAAAEPAEEVADASGVILLPLRCIGWEDPPDRRLRGGVLRAAEEALDRYRDRFGFEQVALILQTPFWEPLAVRMRERFGWKTVYDCLDNYEGFANNRASVLREAEERLARSADLVVASSVVLVQKLAVRNPRARLLSNACDYELFSSVPDRARAGVPLRVGYVGALEEWFDTDLVAALAARRPDWIFDLIGDPRPDVVQALFHLPNVVLRGEKPYGELLSYIKEFDVVAIPHKLTPMTHAADHVKLYEAFAAGLGVVMTPSRAAEPLAARGLVRLAATAQDFEREILAVAAEGPQAAARRRAFARENTWDHRARELESAISALFSPAA